MIPRDRQKQICGDRTQSDTQGQTETEQWGQTGQRTHGNIRVGADRTQTDTQEKTETDVWRQTEHKVIHRDTQKQSSGNRFRSRFMELLFNETLVSRNSVFLERGSGSSRVRV